MDLIVDKSKPGSGNSNDGYNARLFFDDSKKTADITQLDEWLIYGFKILLITITSELPINPDKFELY